MSDPAHSHASADETFVSLLSGHRDTIAQHLSEGGMPPADAPAKEVIRAIDHALISASNAAEYSTALGARARDFIDAVIEARKRAYPQPKHRPAEGITPVMQARYLLARTLEAAPELLDMLPPPIVEVLDLLAPRAEISTYFAARGELHERAATSAVDSLKALPRQHRNQLQRDTDERAFANEIAGFRRVGAGAQLPSPGPGLGSLPR